MFGSSELHFQGRRLCGRRPFALFQSKGDDFEWKTSRADFPFVSGRGDALHEVQCALKWSQENLRASTRRGGAIGFFAYDFARTLEPRAFTQKPPHEAGLRIPDARLVFYEALETDALPESREYSQADADRSLRSVPASPEADPAYLRDIARIKNYIEAGDIYQANLTRHFSRRCQLSARELFQRLTNAHPMPFSALLEYDDFAIVSNSPERFFSLEQRVLAAEPIKGTTRRGHDAEEDEALKLALSQSEKDRAENVMIVDLLRNDLGRVCEFGSVEVPQLCALRTFPTLHHLVSTVTGRLRLGLDATDAMRALFPCGSITGAPKIRAMHILDELENSRRGVAMGAIGYFNFNGDADWNVAIRTMTLQNGTAHFRVGGGITIGSDAESEYREMLLKAVALERALKS